MKELIEPNARSHPNSEWFVFEKGKKRFTSTKMAENLKDAWGKTIEKWQLIVKGYTPDGQVATCGLCNLYFRFYAVKDRSCENCPIFEKTRERCCRGTPFIEWGISGRKKEAQAGLKFLRGIEKKKGNRGNEKIKMV